MSDGEFPAIDGNALGVMVAVNIDVATIAYLIGSVKWLANEDLYEGDVEDVYETSQAFEQLAIRLAAATPSEDSPELVMIPVGTIQMYVGTIAPSGWLLCDSSIYDIADYPELADVLGGNFVTGGTQFFTPDLRGRIPMGYGEGAGLTARNTMGGQYGSETHTLTIAQLPAHTHVQVAHTHLQDAHSHATGGRNNSTLGNAGRFANATTTGTTNDVPTSSDTATNQSTIAVNQNTGSGEAHNNIQPSTVVNFIIKT